MFSKPYNGWVDINIGDHILTASYLTDIPIDFLNSVIFSLKNNVPFSVFIDEEGIEDIICAFYDEVFIIEKEDDKVNYIKIDMNFNLFRKNIIKGIEKYLNEWINWNMGDDINTLKNREEELKTKLSIAKKYLKNKKH